ncbi:hypothetical protein F8B43_1385 [Methylorubrum populi]|uniref:Uncharacterized protein n=1 Tax=Methylorubrum populi TaxID=223967 RepID=A0A833J7V8_9HYPH|nr:hypothetical protein F8B43_1385 [Methylorubrum populi]
MEHLKSHAQLLARRVSLAFMDNLTFAEELAMILDQEAAVSAAILD